MKLLDSVIVVGLPEILVDFVRVMFRLRNRESRHDFSAAQFHLRTLSSLFAQVMASSLETLRLSDDQVPLACATRTIGSETFFSASLNHGACLQCDSIQTRGGLIRNWMEHK